jgi:four helix bundle protein
MNFDQWETTVPKQITGDSLWKVTAYRYALFLSDLSWYDATKLIQDKRTLDLSNQLYRATGFIGANIAEGYSGGTGKDRARFYEYGLGSAKECRDWYYKGRHVLGETVLEHRLGLVTEIIQLLLTMVPQPRDEAIREEATEYRVESADAGTGLKPSEISLFHGNAPMP